MLAVTLSPVAEDEQQSAIQFLALENVLGNEIDTRCVWCIVFRMLSQNQLCTYSTEIQGGMNKYKLQTTQQKTIEKKDLDVVYELVKRVRRAM